MYARRQPLLQGIDLSQITCLSDQADRCPPLHPQLYRMGMMGMAWGGHVAVAAATAVWGGPWACLGCLNHLPLLLRTCR
jgi:hypothetical protein|eukprot:COSAG01_NODE_176_length_22957_cov_72.262096_17_plen_79_part_00